MSNIVRFTATAVLLCAAGCASAPSAPRAEKPQPQEPLDPISEPAANGLADLARRDVDDFLNRRRSAEQTAQSTAEQRREAAEIRWHQADAPTRDAPRTDDPTGSQAADVTEFQPSALFMADEDAIPEQTEPAEQPAGDALKRDRVRELVVELSKELYRDAAHADMPLRELFLIAATTLVSPDRSLNAEAIPGLTPRERDMLRSFQEFFATLGESMDGSKDLEEVISTSLDALRASLRNDPLFEVATAALCTRVGGFGDFTPFDKYAFLAHSEQQAVVYIELTGFTSELNQRGEWVTELAQQLTIYSDRDGIPVWREDWQAAVDVTRNKRHDFFIVQIITLPKALSVGRYNLKLRLRDEKSGAEAETSIPFEMVADPKMAARVR